MRIFRLPLEASSFILWFCHRLVEAKPALAISIAINRLISVFIIIVFAASIVERLHLGESELANRLFLYALFTLPIHFLPAFRVF